MDDRIKIGIDLDNTITASRESIKFFSTLTNLLIAEHRIYIITNRQPNTEQDVADELEYLGIEYNQIVITANKAEYVLKEGITILFEDTDEYFLSLPKNITVFKIREEGNFNFETHKWIASKKTVEMSDEKE